MNAPALILIAVFLGVLLVCVKPFGLYMARVFEGRPGWPLRAGAPLERWIYRLCGVDPEAQLARGHPPQHISGPLVQLLSGGGVVPERGTGEE